MKLEKISNIYVKISIFFIINVMFYVHSFLSTLKGWEIGTLIITTTLFEVIVFLQPDFKKKSHRVIHSLVFLLISSSKIFVSIYVRQYGSYDILSRTRQVEYVRDIGDYFIAQINLANAVIVIFSLLGAYILYSEHHVGISSFVKKFTPKKTLAISLAFYAVLAIGVSYLTSYEYYKCVLTSAIGSFNSPCEALEHEGAVDITSQDVDYLFRNYKHQNDFTGLAKDKNLLIIQVESLQGLVLNRKFNGKEITPNLNKLIAKSFYFTDYYELLGLGNSSDSEYVSLHSAYSTTRDGAYKDYQDTDVYGLPKILKDHGYKTMSMHGNSGNFYERKTMHPKVGFEKSYFGEYYNEDEIIGMGLSDESFFKQSIPIFEKNKDNKFFGFMVTLTCHTPFYMPDEHVVFDYEDGKPKTTFDRYVNAAAYTDKAIQALLDDLEERGILKDTVVVIYGDHHALTKSNPEEFKSLTKFTGKKFDYDEMLKVPLIVYVPGYEKPVVCNNTGSQLDFLPTILNLFGLNDTMTPMFGVDLLDENLSKNNTVYPQTYMTKGSYINHKQFFEKDQYSDDTGRLVDRNTRKELEKQKVDYHSKVSEDLINLSNYIYLNDKVRYVIELFEKSNLEKE